MPLFIKDNQVDYWLNRNTPIKFIEEIINSNKGIQFVIKRYPDDDNKPYEQLKMF